MSRIAVFWVMWMVASAGAQVVISEIMFYPDTLAAYTEYVEIYNAGEMPVSLEGWRIGDSLDLDTLQPVSGEWWLAPGQFGVILDPGYFGGADIYDTRIPDTARVFTIEDARFGRYGLPNNRPLTLFLVTADGDTVQQVTYVADNSPGFSEEKIHLTADNRPENWGNGRVFRGTPGSINSLSPKPYDLAIADVERLTPTVWVGEPVDFRWKIINRGMRPATQYRMVVFWDNNLNGQLDPADAAFPVENQVPLNPGDSLQVSFSVTPDAAGLRYLGFFLEYPADQDTMNNLIIQELVVEDPQVELIINEIMFEPQSGYAEWIEIFNAGNRPVNLRYYRLSDFRDTVSFAPVDDVLPVGAYRVLGGDSAILWQYTVAPERVQILPRFPTLNNDVDELSILSPAGRVLDRVRYFGDWYGREVEKGTSLEKIHPRLSGQDGENWAASVASSGSTPGRQNSVYVELLPPAMQVRIHPNPFSPDGDGREDFTIIQFQVPVETAYAQIVIFDLAGRRIRQLVKDQPVAHRAQFVWDGRDDHGRLARTGLYICLIQVRNEQKKLFREARATVVLVKK
ncbi:MAG: hypothetical protein GXO78_00260 [Calditrichaeota bacterium]|nr:hypothetical protein [Calditrichota bacterium]